MSISQAPATFAALFQGKHKVSNANRVPSPFTPADWDTLYQQLLASGLTVEAVMKFASSFVDARPGENIYVDDMVTASRRFAYREPVAGIFRRFAGFFNTSFRIPVDAESRTALLRDWVDALHRENISPDSITGNVEAFLEKHNSSFAPTAKQFADFCVETSIQANVEFYSFCERMAFRYKNFWNATPEYKKFLYNDLTAHGVADSDYEKLESEITLDSRFLDYPPNTNNIIVIAKYLKIKDEAISPSLAYKVAINPKHEHYNHWMIREARRRVGSYELRVDETKANRTKLKFDAEYAGVISDAINGLISKTDKPAKEEFFIPQGDPVSSVAFFDRLLNGK